MVVGSSSHGGERKRQLGLVITVSMSGTHLQIRLGPHKLESMKLFLFKKERFNAYTKQVLFCLKKKITEYS